MYVVCTDVYWSLPMARTTEARSLTRPAASHLPSVVLRYPIQNIGMDSDFSKVL